MIRSAPRHISCSPRSRSGPRPARSSPGVDAASPTRSGSTTWRNTSARNLALSGCERAGDFTMFGEELVEIFDGLGEAVFERGLGLPVEEGGGLGDVGAALDRVVDGERAAGDGGA